MFCRAALSKLERILQNSINATAGENTLLRYELFRRAFFLNAANGRVFAFHVFPHDHHIDVTGLATRQRAGHAVEKTYRSQVDVLVELAADRN